MTGEHSYLVLRDVRPAANRYRSYEIRIGRIELRDGRRQLSVVLTWGRIGHKKQSKTFFCPQESEMLRLLQPVLRTRYRHGYQLIAKGRNFPALPLLEEFPRGAFRTGAQLTLF